MKNILTVLLKIFPRYNFVKSIIIALFCFGISPHSFSQEHSDLSNYPGKWIYTNNNLSGEWYGERYYKMNPTELQKYHSTTEKLVNYLHQQPIAQNPLGVNLNVQSRCAYIQFQHDLLSAATERVKAEIYMPFCYFYERNGKIGYYSDEVSCIKLRTNDISTAFESICNNSFGDIQAFKDYHDILILPKKLRDLGSGVFFYDGYYNNYIIVASNERPLWSPITIREYTNKYMACMITSMKESNDSSEKIEQELVDALKNEIADRSEEHT